MEAMTRLENPEHTAPYSSASGPSGDDSASASFFAKTTNSGAVIGSSTCAVFNFLAKLEFVALLCYIRKGSYRPQAQRIRAIVHGDVLWVFPLSLRV